MNTSFNHKPGPSVNDIAGNIARSEPFVYVYGGGFQPEPVIMLSFDNIILGFLNFTMVAVPKGLHSCINFWVMRT